MPDPVLSTTWSIFCQLKDLRATQHSNRDECARLAKVIERLHNNLQILLASPDVGRFQPVLRKIEVSTTNCYAFVESISARGLRSTFLSEKIPVFNERALDQFLLQHDELHTLTDELLQELLKGFRPGKHHVPTETVFGVSKLRATSSKDDDVRLRKGERASIIFIEDGGKEEMFYSVDTWVVTHEQDFFSWPSTDLAATVTCRHTGRVFDVSQPASGNESLSIAAISASGVLWANVNSIRPGGGRWGPFSKPAGSLLKRDHESIYGDGAYSYGSQDYQVEICLTSGAGFEADLQLLRVTGTKEQHQTYYKCCLDGSGEVVAIYRHSTEECEGTLHLLGRGNQAQLRDVIVSSIAALGLTSTL